MALSSDRSLYDAFHQGFRAADDVLIQLHTRFQNNAELDRMEKLYNVDPQTKKSYEERYLCALENPLNELRETVIWEEFPLSLLISKSRGGLPILVHNDSGLTDKSIDHTPTAIIANAAALSFNELGFARAVSDIDVASYILGNSKEYAFRLLAFTRKDDEFIYEETDNEETNMEMLQILNSIADSYENIGIQVTRNFKGVRSVYEWIATEGQEKPLLANAYDPYLLANFGRTENEREVLFSWGLKQAAAYTKKGSVETMRNAGVATPYTEYYNLQYQPLTPGRMAEIYVRFSGYNQLVVSKEGGAGGTGVKFLKKNETYTWPQNGQEDEDVLKREILEHFANKEVMIQGLMELHASPCLIANITPQDIEYLIVTQQRFAEPGVHAGNVLTLNPQEIRHMLPADFWAQAYQALKALQEKGIFGQINLDFLIVSPEFTGGDHYQLESQTNVREANIRLAGSSLLLTVIQGNIEQQPIHRVHTVSMQVPIKAVLDGSLQEMLNNFAAQFHDRKVVMVSFDMNKKKKATFAFVSIKDISREELEEFENAFEREVLEPLRAAQLHTV